MTIALLAVARPAIADLSVFTGAVTGVDDPFGDLSSLAAFGVPVGASFDSLGAEPGRAASSRRVTHFAKTAASAGSYRCRRARSARGETRR